MWDFPITCSMLSRGFIYIHCIMMNNDVRTCLQNLCQSLNLAIDDIDSAFLYLDAEWNTTKTEVALDLSYPPYHIIMAYMMHYQCEPFKNAGQLVETLLDLMEGQVGVENVNPLVEGLQSKTIARIIKLRRETLILFMKSRCKVCYKNEANLLSIRCKHLALCLSCFKERAECPVCDLPIRRYTKVYRV